MKPPSSKGPGGRSGPPGRSSAKPFRPGGPRPSTPRPQADKPPRAQRRPEQAAASARVVDRPVLTIATKGAFGRPEPERASPRDERRNERRDERPRDDRPRDDRPRDDRAQEDRPFAKRPVRQMREPRAPVVRHDIDAPRGTIWLYGIHAIGAALQNPQRRLRRLLLTEEAEAAMAAIFPKPWPIPSESTERARLDLLLGQNVVHQGAALLADPLGSPSLQQALERPGPVLVLDQVHDPRNIGAIMRSAAVFGCACVITQDRNAPDESGALAKAASGALEKIPLLRAVNIARTLIALKAAGCWVIGLDAAGLPLSGPALSARRVALVLGSEGEGMRRLTRETCDELAGIPMIGGAGSAIDSLNVSAACTVALYELSRPA